MTNGGGPEKDEKVMVQKDQTETKPTSEQSKGLQLAFRSRDSVT